VSYSLIYNDEKLIGGMNMARPQTKTELIKAHRKQVNGR